MNQEFVGREKELASLNAFLQRASRGETQVCFVTGEAGAGKSTLMAEFVRQAQDANDKLVVVSGNCNAQTGISDPYLPFRHILSLLIGDEARLASNSITKTNANRLKHMLKTSGRALVEVAPELVGTLLPVAGILVALARLGAKEKGWLDGLEKHAKATEKSSRDIEQPQIFLQFTALLRTISQEYPMVIILDDLHWIDTASNALFFHLVREVTDCPILFVGLYRANDVAAGRNNERHPLESVVNEIKRYWGDVWIDLDQTTTNDGQAFVDSLIDSLPNKLDQTFRDALFKHTNGHALFTTELLKQMRENGEIVQDEQGYWQTAAKLDWQQLPAKVEAVIKERIERLQEQLREILSIAAVEGTDFTAEVIAQLLQMEHRYLIRSLSQDLDRQHRLVREIGQLTIGHSILSRYTFSHILAQLYLYNRLGQAERRLLHGDIADALEALYAGHSQEIAVQLAHHYTEAGKSSKTFLYLRQAGDQAYQVSEFNQARQFYNRALGLLRDNRSLNQKADHAYLLRRIGKTYSNIGLLIESESYYRQSVDYARQAGDKNLLAQSLLDLTHSLRRQRKSGEAQETIKEALTITRESGNRALEGNALRVLGTVLRQTEEIEGRIAATEQAYQIALEIGDANLERSCLNSMGVTYSLFGNYLKAVEYYEQAYQLAVQQHSITSQAFYSTNLFGYQRLGANQKAKAMVERTFTLHNRLGNVASTYDSYQARGILHMHDNNIQQAIENWLESVQIADQYQRPVGRVSSRSWLIIGYLITNQLKLAAQQIEEQKILLTESSPMGSQVYSEVMLEGILCLRLEQREQAKDIFEQELEQAIRGLPTQRWRYRYHRAFAQAGLTLLFPPTVYADNLSQAQAFFDDAVAYCGWVGVVDDALIILREMRKADSDDLLKPIEEYLVEKREIAWANRPFPDE